MQFLRADQTNIVHVGPFVDVADGFTPQVDIDISGTNEAELMKYGSTTVTDISGNTWAAITSNRGWYNLTLTSANADTEGQLDIMIQDDSDCLPVHKQFTVVNANVYDSLFAPATTDYLQTDTVSIAANAITATAINADAITAAKIADNAIAAEHIAAAAIDNATFAADVGSTDYATNIIALAADKALVEQGLDHLLRASEFGDAANGSIFAKLVSSGATADWSTYNNTLHSLQAQRVRGDAAYITATGFAVAGDQMDLVDAPNSTAVTAIQSGLSTLTATDIWNEDISGIATAASAGGYFNAVLTDTGTTIPDQITALNDVSAAEVWSAVTRTLTADTNISGMDVNVTEIDGGAISGTGSQLADGFSYWYDVATPTKTMNDAGVAGAGLAAADVWNYDISGIAGAGSAGTVVNATLTDTGTTIPAQITALNNIAAVDIWNEDISGIATAASAGGIANAILTDTGTTIPTLGGPGPWTTGGSGTLTATDIWNVDISGIATANSAGTVVNAILTGTDTTIPNQITALNDTSAGEVWTSVSRTLTASTNLGGVEVDVTKIAGGWLAETSDGNIADNFSTYFDNADAATIKTVDDVGGGAATVPPSIR